MMRKSTIVHSVTGREAWNVSAVPDWKLLTDISAKDTSERFGEMFLSSPIRLVRVKDNEEENYGFSI